MDPRVEEIALEESAKSKISPEKFIQMAENSCKKVFKDDLNSRIKTLGGTEYPKESLRFLLLTLVYGSALESAM